MKIRLEGTEEEIRAFLVSLEDIVFIEKVSKFYPNRNSDGIGRVYINLVEPIGNDGLEIIDEDDVPF